MDTATRRSYNKKVKELMPYVIMQKISHYLKLFKHILRSKDDYHRSILLVAVSLTILLLGGIILIFSSGGNSAKQDKATEVHLTCHDSDGYNASSKGAVTYTDQAGKHVDEDFCAPTEKAVYEMVCRKPSFWSLSSVPDKKTIDCPKGCINGACVK